MTNPVRTIKIWDLPLRLFHWLLFIAIAVAFLSSEEDSVLNQWHILAGWVAGLLILFRLVWGFAGGEHSRFADFVRPSRIAAHIGEIRRGRMEPSLGHNPLGGIAVLVLLALTAITIWSGAFGGESAEELHEIVAWTLLAMVGVHILAVLIMSFLERENLVRAMVTGRKDRKRHPAARDAWTPGPIGIVITLLVVVAAVFAVLRYDPQAFTLRSAESFEHRADAAGASLADSHENGDRDGEH